VPENTDKNELPLVEHPQQEECGGRMHIVGAAQMVLQRGPEIHPVHSALLEAHQKLSKNLLHHKSRTVV